MRPVAARILRKTLRRTGDPVDRLVSRFSRFLERSERSPLTARTYVDDLIGFAGWHEMINGGPFEPRRVTATDLRLYKRTLIEDSGLKPATINRKLASLRSFLRWAAQIGLVGQGRIPTIPKTLPIERRGPRWLDRREQHALFRAVERGGRTRDVAIVKLLINTGLRVGELCALTWQDVALSERKGRLTVRHGKGGKRREIPLNKDARNALLAMEYADLAGKNRPIFHGQRGPLTSRGVQILLGNYLEPAGLEGVSPHTLRHSFCKNLVDAGVGLEQVAALAGHESLDITRRYCEPSIKDLEQAVDRIGEEE